MFSRAVLRIHVMEHLEAVIERKDALEFKL